jgi:hypothetical protein
MMGLWRVAECDFRLNGGASQFMEVPVATQSDKSHQVVYARRKNDRLRHLHKPKREQIINVPSLFSVLLDVGKIMYSAMVPVNI